MSTEFASFDELLVMIEAKGIQVSLSALQGQLFGCVLAGVLPSFSQWLQDLQAESMVEQAFETLEEEQVLKQLYDSLLGGFLQRDYGEYGFILLLPGDEEPIQVRLEALSDWASGLLLGLGLGGLTQENTTSEMREMLTDVHSISLVDSQVNPSEEAEKHYVELVEYLRVIVFALSDYKDMKYSVKTSNEKQTPAFEL